MCVRQTDATQADAGASPTEDPTSGQRARPGGSLQVRAKCGGESEGATDTQGSEDRRTFVLIAAEGLTQCLRAAKMTAQSWRRRPRVLGEEDAEVSVWGIHEEKGSANAGLGRQSGKAGECGAGQRGGTSIREPRHQVQLLLKPLNAAIKSILTPKCVIESR